MTQVIKVSKQGINVGTATDPNDFIFDSTLNTFKIIATGTVGTTIGTTGDGVEGSVVTAHGQSGVPFAIAYMRDTAGWITVPGGQASNSNFWFTNLKTDGTNLYFYYVNNAGSSYATSFRYYLCEPPL